MSQFIKDMFTAKLTVCQTTLKKLLIRLEAIPNESTSMQEKFNEISFIKQEMAKIAIEIDKVKQEVKVINQQDNKNLN